MIDEVEDPIGRLLHMCNEGWSSSWVGVDASIIIEVSEEDCERRDMLH